MLYLGDLLAECEGAFALRAKYATDDMGGLLVVNDSGDALRFTDDPSEASRLKPEDMFRALHSMPVRELTRLERVPLTCEFMTSDELMAVAEAASEKLHDEWIRKGYCTFDGDTYSVRSEPGEHGRVRVYKWSETAKCYKELNLGRFDELWEAFAELAMYVLS